MAKKWEYDIGYSGALDVAKVSRAISIPDIDVQRAVFKNVIEPFLLLIEFAPANSTMTLPCELRSFFPVQVSTTQEAQFESLG